MRPAIIAAAVTASATVHAQPESTVAIGGYVETYYQLHLQAPSNHVTALRGFDARDRTFTLANVALDAKATRGAVTVRAILQVGSTPTIYYGAEQDWKYLQQATVAYAARSGLVIEAGLVPSPIGPEVIPVKDNWSWSRSDLFYALPFYHTGVRATYPLAAGWTGTVHLYNGWNTVEDNNASPSVAVSVAYASERVTGQALYFGGIERPSGAPEGSGWRHLLDAYAVVAISDQVGVVAHIDGGFERTAFGTSGWVGAAAGTKLVLSPRLYAAARIDGFREWVAHDGAGAAQPMFWPTAWIGSGTATLAYQPAEGMSVRLEYRHDQARSLVFYGGEVTGGVPNRDMQDTVTIGATAWF